MIVRDFLICLLQMYLLEDLEKNMLPYRRENFLGKFLVYFVIALVMLGINHLESSIFNMVMIPVTYMIVSMVVFRGNIWKKLVIVCCYYVLAIIPEFLFATLTNAYGVTGASEGFGTEIEKTLALLLMSTMTFLFIKCINQVTRKRDYLTIENKTFTVLLMLPTATIIILGCVFYSNISFEGMNRVMVPVGASLLLLTNIFIFSVFDRFVEKSEEVKKMARLYQKSRAEIANLQYMNKVNEDNRAFLHDINKFICTVAGLMEEGENQEVKEIMEHLGVRIQSLQKGVYCEHPILNSILCERKFLAESKNISYKITLGNDLRLDFLEELDMISIVGNLLDNALEAAEKTKDELMGILGKGSDRSRLLSKNLNVPMYTDIKEINQNVDAACVVVPNAAGGGNGANIAKSILAKGIPTLLEHPAHEVEIVNCIRESGSAAFMLNPFYRYIKPIRDFLEAAQIISKHAHLINASLECAIHVLYDGIDILGCALGGLSTWKLGNVAESYTTSMAGGGNRVISGIIGMVPVTFIVNTNVDRNDIDHPLHLYHRIELTFSTGRLCLVNTHGPVIWLPFLHMPRDEYGTLSINVEEEVNIPSGVTIGNVMLPSVKETFEQIWPDAVKKALEILFKQNRTEKMSMAQYQIYVSKLWSEICQKVGYMNIVDYDNFGDIKSIFYDLEKRHLIKKENDGIE
jgi:thiazolinyl imide reductase